MEDGELALSRGVPVDSPEEIVLELLFRRRAEAHDLNASGVERARHTLDRTVLARRVPPLKDDQNAVLSSTPHELLQFSELFFNLRELYAGLVLVDVLRRARRNLVERYLLSLVDPDGVHHRSVRGIGGGESIRFLAPREGTRSARESAPAA